MENEKTTVLVGRKWNNPAITICISHEEIKIAVNLRDFLVALAAETGNPTTLLTVAGLRKALIKASERVVSGMKEETSRVI